MWRSSSRGTAEFRGPSIAGEDWLDANCYSAGVMLKRPQRLQAVSNSVDVTQRTFEWMTLEEGGAGRASVEPADHVAGDIGSLELTGDDCRPELGGSRFSSLHVLPDKLDGGADPKMEVLQGQSRLAHQLQQCGALFRFVAEGARYLSS